MKESDLSRSYMHTNPIDATFNPFDEASDD